jgi:DNA repair exonuclease SbcCD ATPase subunit
LMSELDKDKLRDIVDKMKLDSEDLEKQLDRTLELFKQLEVEQKLKESIEDLKKLAEEQKKLSEESEESKSSDSEKLKEEQQKLSEKFDDIAKGLDDLKEKNDELEFPQDIADSDSEVNDIQEDMEKSEEQLGDNKPKKASESQKSAGEKMEDLANKMEMQMQQNAQQQAEEDMAALRMLLENLIKFSFNQEALMQDLKNINPNNPQYMKLSQRQRELLDDARVLEDSLLALSKRVVQIQSLVNTEISAINNNLDKSVRNMQDRKVPHARSNQQYVMTSVNNLALMLTEAFEQMQKQMAESKGSGACKKPGSSGKPSPSAAQMRKLQQKLNAQMKALKGKMDGKKKGEGKGQGKRGSGMSEELARLAAQQEALRNELQKYSQQQNKDGTGSLGNLDKLAKQMEETEKDLVNRRLSQETLARQEEILTRLLESEKAEREREQENRRESKEFGDLITGNPGQFEEYKKLKMKEAELLKTIPPSLNGFYKNLVNTYFETLEN